MSLKIDYLLECLADPGSYQSWDVPLDDPPPTVGYAEALRMARHKTGRDESVTAGECTINGRRVAVVGGDPTFLGGSIGVAAGERLTAAIERATGERLPIIALPVGGGTRMQEGTVAFLQMVKITAAVLAHKEAHLPYLVYLRNPTMGGVFASWGSLGHVTFAEPGALVGFLGPRVYEALYGQPFPPGVQQSDNLAELGIIDRVLPPDELRAALHKLLNVLVTRSSGERSGERDWPPLGDTPAWESVQRTRRDDRPGLRELLAHAATDVTMLNGTGDGETHPGSVLALARWADTPCVVVGQDRADQGRPLDPAALREVRRGIRLARELKLPLVSVIDTPGAALSKEAEERGMASEIARTLADLLSLETPTVSLLLGQGTGGIALALTPADRVVCSEHAWLSPLPPEGASAIVHRDVDHAEQLAEAQGIRSRALRTAGIVDVIVPEPDDPAADVAQFCGNLAAALHDQILAACALSDEERLGTRRVRFRTLGWG
ncbi:carboxyl transferase domain-containing protein [Tessaracoccus sp. OH4464_COT-324]|uniref:carboxyl transferase domain-containing protein n=1 Tax=Tessaracoccus sp. OH4464_COT-324 TaxID=2491059 RepID=UPI000F63A8EA|nr:carboxyl transferase domain-containing protein [Tessaracoccus sp. OH4464_COT-324]RRD47008.1 acetyl-CoA carboxyl transferase [Tessaracoccus sp. OH4464_COT-324]